jgi:hypothetical protein
MTITETGTAAELTGAQRAAAERVDALDLDPIAYKLMHPEPGVTTMTLAGADQLIAAYRCFLKLCAWYPDQGFVPSRAVDEAWHAHILDTAKYARDTRSVFGAVLHHFPYLGLRGEQDEAAWRAAYARTRGMFREHFGIELPADRAAAGDCGSACNDEGGSCDPHAALTRERPRPTRA